jgi:hypothetical protein
MILLKLVALPLVLIADGSGFPSAEEQARIGEPYSACMEAEAKRIDDPQVDVAVVGKAVATACKSQFEEMITAMTRSLSMEDREMVRVRLTEMQIGFATAAVGKVRFARRARPALKPESKFI